MEQAEDWEEEVEKLKQELGEVPMEHTVFRLPAWYIETNKHLYVPKMVAIGPYHHHNESLKAMEKHKWRSLQNICLGDVKNYREKVGALERKARDCYSENVQMESADFVKMLLLDGCFIIDYFQKLSSENADPICNVGWAKIHLYSDLFLLENQIPFFVIHDLFIERNGRHDCQDHKNNPLLELFCGPLKKIFSTEELIPPKISCNEIHHLLQLYYQCMPIEKYHIDHLKKGDHIIQMEQSNLVNGESHSSCLRLIFSQYTNREKDASLQKGGKANKISCVSELHEAGVTFKEKQDPIDMFDITFKNGVMEIPFLKVEDFVILWNMLAFEQSELQSYKLPVLSSYLALMDSLINTEKDVTLLERAGVLENYLHSNEYAAELFNQFSKSFVLDYSNHYYQNLFQEVKRYSNSTWHKYKARLKHDYFSNPWTTISVMAASVLLLLTGAQTYSSYNYK